MRESDFGPIDNSISEAFDDGEKVAEPRILRRHVCFVLSAQSADQQIESLH